VRTDLLVLAVVVGAALLSMPMFALGAHRGGPDRLESSARGTFVLGAFVRDWFYWFIRPIERGVLAMGLGPLVFNVLGALLGVLAGVFFAGGALVAGGWSVFGGGVADVLDGRIARARGIADARGAFLDSTLDRYAEVGAFVGLAVWFRGDALWLVAAVVALGGSLLVSYARARGESLGVVCKVGVLQRAERLLMLGFGGLLDPAVSAWLGRETPGALMGPVLALIAVGTVATSLYRVVWIARRLKGVEEVGALNDPDAASGPPPTGRRAGR
jgi:CDP-diacylglycerol--glycerol-3-phosphate 3-phosphatidyltransferase